MSIPSDILERALGLPESDRAELASRLILSLEPDGDGPETEDAAWAAELEERLRRFEAGESKAIPIEEALDQIRQSLRAGRPS